MDENKDFTVVKITLEDNSELDNKIVLVPTSYVSYNANIPQHYVRYLPQPHTSDDLDFIEGMVKRQVLPVPKSWTYYECNILCTADTYEEAKTMMEEKDKEKETEKVPRRKKKEKPVTSAKQKEGNSTKALQKKQHKSNNDVNFINAETYCIAKESVRSVLFEVPEIHTDSNICNQENGNTVAIDGNDKLPGTEALANQSTNTVDVNRNSSSRHVSEAPLKRRENTTASPLIDLIQESATADQIIGAVPRNMNADHSLNIIQGNESAQSVIDITQDIVSKNDLKKLKNAIINAVKDEFKTFNTKFTSIELQLSELQNLVLSSKPALQNNVMSFLDFQGKYTYSFPLQTMKDFEKLDDDLKDKDLNTYKDLYLHFTSTISEKKEIVDSFTLIFKAFFSRELLQQFTAQKKNQDKKLFKDTTFYVCLRESIFKIFNSEKAVVEEKTIKQVIGLVINNSKDWDGYRRQREAEKIKKKLEVENH